MTENLDVFDRLMQQLQERVRLRPAGSYTTKLLSGGVQAIGAKVTEEATEVVEAAEELEGLARTAGPANGLDSTEQMAKARAHVIYEAGDVIYHLWVLLASQGITLDELRSELARREGTSGLEEKRRRNEPA